MFLAYCSVDKATPTEPRMAPGDRPETGTEAPLDAGSIRDLVGLADAFDSGPGADRPAVRRGFVGATVAEFGHALADLGLLGPEELHPFLRGLPGDGTPGGEALARALIAAGKLTRYQASAIHQGKAKILAIGPYLVIDRLGKGGMGVVFKARHRDFRDLVALKILTPSSSQNAEAVHRFRREARLLARLEHPNLVTSHDIGEHGGVHFLVMDHVDGVDLDQLVKSGGPLRPGRAVDLIVQAARGLGAAHARRIVHRDLKPANLMLDAAGTVRVLDLGLARVVGAGGDDDDRQATQDRGLTGTGVIMGTVDYLSPEQSKDSKRADHRADIYSLGCTFHFLLSGKPPYPRETVMQRLLAHHQDEVPSLRASRPEIPRPLDAAFRRMLAKHPDHRPQTMARVIEELEACRGPRTSGKLLLVFGDEAAGPAAEPAASLPGTVTPAAPVPVVEAEPSSYDILPTGAGRTDAAARPAYHPAPADRPAQPDSGPWARVIMIATVLAAVAALAVAGRLVRRPGGTGPPPRAGTVAMPGGPD